jgi:hypothetical protein
VTNGSCQVKRKYPLQSLIAVTENVKQLNKQRHEGKIKQNKKKKPCSAAELKILSVIFLLQIEILTVLSITK